MDPLIIFLNDLAVLVLSIVAGFFLRSFFPSYFGEKGKNFATKQDIEEITEKQSRIHAQYDSQLETLRSQLEMQSHRGKLAFENEYPILQRLWKALDALQLPAKILYMHQPEFPLTDQRQQQLTEDFRKKFLALTAIVRSNRPFYSKEIYAILDEIVLRTEGDTDYYWTKNIFNMRTFEERMTDLGTLQKNIDRACEEIRKRLFST